MAYLTMPAMWAGGGVSLSCLM
uniref:Uncharacterized protein n=1 Tax=Rhodnius prolixus TaxID=13249 RepID=T1I8Q8_RHOPR